MKVSRFDKVFSDLVNLTKLNKVNSKKKIKNKINNVVLIKMIDP